METDSLNLPQTKVSKAVAAVITSAENKRKNDVLADEVEHFQMQVCLKKIPPRNKTSKITLPYSILRPNLEVCLFVKDLDKKDRDYEPTVSHFQELFSKKEVSSITEIVPLKSLRLEYQPYEAKRNLSNAYDIFLADERIMKFLPRLLGKHFYDEKKFPVPICLQAEDLTKEISKAIETCKCIISNKGSSSMVTVGHSGMSQSELTDNVIAVGEQLSSCVPGALNNIKQLLLKTRSSVSVPIFMSTGGPQDVVIPNDNDTNDDNEAEEISTVVGAKVKVYSDGRVLLIHDGETEEDAQKREVSAEGIRKRKRPIENHPAIKKLRKQNALSGGEEQQAGKKEKKRRAGKRVNKKLAGKKENKKPATARENEEKQPVVKKENKKPPGKKENKKPATARETEEKQPVGKRENKKPATARENEEKKPAGKKENKPAGKKQNKKPAVKQEEKHPAANKGKKQPVAKKESKQPVAEKEESQPAAKRQKRTRSGK